jgi:hypothetical protein
LGSAPAEIFCVWTGLKRESIAAFSFSRSTLSFYKKSNDDQVGVSMSERLWIHKPC